MINSLQGNVTLANMVDIFDIIFIDSPSLFPASKVLIQRQNYIYYIHGAIMSSRPRPILTFKPHRLLMHALTTFITDYNIFRVKDRVYANSLFTAMLSKNALGYKPDILYPPVDIGRVVKYRDYKEPIVSMLARFGASKGWDLTLIAFSEAVNKCGVHNTKLYLMGSVNSNVQATYVNYILGLSRKLGIDDKVKILINPSIDDIYRMLNKSMVFIHVRPNEPFGIVVAEAMAAGAVPIVHKSGGPWFDIVEMGKYGYGFINAEEAADALCRVLTSDREFEKMSNLAKEKADEFSYEKFKDRIDNIISKFT
ncbi:glycosyl transferase, family 1 [Thermoproteus uzoniensis 768-20]|uniref:Glycosyl transferase, family 1 n=2 Tax=Thermoproteus TaxID=2270 RepID=F2L671_THEU7|nr:glycosyl transferase, family 1 [Thermoproteus uzoniensis 768-20]